MAAERNPSPRDVPLPKLLAMYFSPLAMLHRLERPLPSQGLLATTGIRYRNSLFLFRHLDTYINRSAGVALACLFAQPVLTHLVASVFLYAALFLLMLAAILHTVFLGFYRQVLNQRIDRCAEILGVERPSDRDAPQAYPRSDLDRCGPPLKSTRKLPLRDRKGPRAPR